MTDALRVCFLCNEYPPGPHGGIGTLTRTLARALVEIGHEARAVGIYPDDYPAPDFEEDAGVRVWRLLASAGRGGWLRSRARLFQTVAAWVRTGEVDLVEVPDWEGWAAGWPDLPAPVVARLSGSAAYFAAEMNQRVRRVAYWLERASLRRADFRCSESLYTGERTRQVFGLDRAADAVIYNPVEIPAETGSRARSRRVVFAGTLTEKKGIYSLWRAWPIVLRARPDAELHVFGKDGAGAGGHSTREILESQLTPAVSASVRFRGHVGLEELQKELSAARVAVLPSYAEGFSLTPLHAMAGGCPTIYTRRGSGPEVIDDGDNGLLVDPDRPEEIAAAILRVLSDDALAERLSLTRRRRVVERFSPEVLIRENEAFYRNCLDRFAAKRRAA